MSTHTRLIIGAMSGTSADGVDIAITRIQGRGLDMKPQLLHHHHRAYDDETRKMIFAARESPSTTLATCTSATSGTTIASGTRWPFMKSTSLIRRAAPDLSLPNARGS